MKSEKNYSIFAGRWDEKKEGNSSIKQKSERETTPTESSKDDITPSDSSIRNGSSNSK